MQVQINTANNVDGEARMLAFLESLIRQRLSRFDGRLTRAEMHIGDENAAKIAGRDKRCALEVRPAGLGPITVIDHAATVEAAVSGAAQKMASALDHALGKRVAR